MSNLQISLAAARVNANMTQEDVAKAMNVSQTTIVNWEKGKVVPGIPEMDQFSCKIGPKSRNGLFNIL